MAPSAQISVGHITINITGLPATKPRSTQIRLENITINFPGSQPNNPPSTANVADVRQALYFQGASTFFTKFPPEIRQHILRDVFSGSRASIVVINRDPRLRKKLRLQSTNHKTILVVCRRFRDEFAHLYWSMTPVSMWPRWHAVQVDLLQIPRSLRTCFVHLRDLNLDVTGEELEEILKHFPNLKTCTVPEVYIEAGPLFASRYINRGRLVRHPRFIIMAKAHRRAGLPEDSAAIGEQCGVMILQKATLCYNQHDDIRQHYFKVCYIPHLLSYLITVFFFLRLSPVP